MLNCQRATVIVIYWDFILIQWNIDRKWWFNVVSWDEKPTELGFKSGFIVIKND